MNFDYSVLIHRLYDSEKPKSGGLDIVLDQLVKNGKSILYIESPLVPKVYPFITVSIRSRSGTENLEKIRLLFKFSLLARLHEIFILLYLPIKYKLKNTPCITSDPLTTAPVILLKKLGLVRYVYYHCIDYSEKRFPNKLVNFVYRSLLDFSLFNADLVGCVTKRIEAILHVKGVKKLFYIPNSPCVSDYQQYLKSKDERVRNKLVVTCAGVSRKYRILDTIDLFEKLLPRFPDATLTVIGSFAFEPTEYQEVINYLNGKKFSSKVQLLGQLSRHENTKEISTGWIGLAFYDKSYSHVNFGDSLKIREYAALGIPTVSDKTTPTSLEMVDKGAGIAVNEPWDALDPLIKIMSDDKLYETIMVAALAWAKSVDKEDIVNELVRDHLSIYE
jgi:glycosyltransferase involved in cell wall biosynthesis